MAHLQYAIDVTDEKQALRLAQLAHDNGVQWVEAGHVLVKAVGVSIVTKFKEIFPDGVVVADMKTMDMGAEEVRVAAKAGADVVMICGGAASDGVVHAAVNEAKLAGVRLTASLMGVRDQYTRAMELDSMGLDFILAHRGIDDTFEWFDTENLCVLERMVADVKTPLAIGGSITEAKYPILQDLGFSIIISGRGITEAADPGQAAKRLVELASKSSALQR
jgi:3-hexulose-6-phosphate synthase/6-phospho-3-hexuloisomerase